MIQRYASITFFLIICLFSFGQDNDNAVVELKKAVFHIHSLEKISFFYTYKVTIFNEEGAKFGNINIHLDKSEKIKKFKGNVLDENGKKIRKISSSDLNTVSDFKGYTLFADNMKKVAKIQHYSFPYTIEYQYELQSKTFLGCWLNLLDGFNIGTKKVELIIKTPESFRINHKANNYQGSYNTYNVEGFIIHEWKAENIKSIKKEKLSPNYYDLVPTILVTPQEFIYSGTHCKADSWGNYGKWVWDLIEEQDELPESTISEVRNMTSHVQDTIDKIKIVYNYLQAKTRYVSIQKGIGGFQPASAAEVDNYKYGDCKALSNYMKSLLSAIHIKSIYTEIGSGEYSKIRWPGLPGVYQTNHIILTIPLARDTFWLECTSRHSPFGYIGEHNSGRKAILIEEQGGKLIDIPCYRADNNYRSMNAVVDFSAPKKSACKLSYKYSGVMMDFLIQLHSYDKDIQRKILLEKYPTGNFKIQDFILSNTNDAFPQMTLGLNLNGHEHISNTGNLYSFKINYLERFRNPLNDNNRINDIYIPNSICYSDTINYILPENFIPELVPEIDPLETDYGKYNTSIQLNGNTLLYTRELTINGGSYSVSRFEELNRFFNEIQSKDNQLVIFRKPKQ